MGEERAELGRYMSYLLRLWETSSEDDLIWRASLESPSSGKRLGFASLEELFTFLKDETNQRASTETETRSG